jgi:hypothetical protein
VIVDPPDTPPFRNPFKPGAGHMPPYLAGREAERQEFIRLLGQTVILENLILTGLRGVGKTVLLDSFKPIAIEYGWHWVGTDLSESASATEEALAIRLLADLSVVSGSMVLGEADATGFAGAAREVVLDFNTIRHIYEATPGLIADKLKVVLETVAKVVAREQKRGMIFAYDEAQNLTDSPKGDQASFPLSLLLDVFQSIQKKEIPFMLVLTGLPTLLPKLVEARTFSERMFHVVTLDRLDDEASRKAVLRPIEDANCPVKFSEESVETVCRESGGYPYFIQFICREVYDAFIQAVESEGHVLPVPLEGITQKLDADFFAGRWARATDRQRQLLWCAAHLDNSSGEFAAQDIVEESSKVLAKRFSSSHTNQMLSTLTATGLIYKNRWGRYSFAIPLLDRFILRQAESIEPAQLV